MAPKLSVVVPFYGVEDYLDACLASIAAQTFPDFECVLVDDGSPDGSRAIAERWCAADERFRLVTRPNGGLGAARNTGTEQASGEYLMFVDSDDLLAPRAFARLVGSLDATGSDFAGGNVWRLSPRWGLFVSPAHSEEFKTLRQRVTIDDVPLLMRDRMIWNKVYRRSFWDAGGYAFPEMRFEDYPVTLKAHLEASAVDLLPEPMYVWRERETGTSISQQGFDIANVRDRVEAVHLVLDFVDELASDEVKRLVDSYFVQVDLREVMTSLLTVDAAHQDEVERLIASLADRLHPDRVDLAPEFNQLFYRAARAHDWPLCRALARWHNREGWAGVRRELPRRQWRTPLRVSALAQIERTQLPDPLKPRPLVVHYEQVRSQGDEAIVEVSIDLRAEVARIARVGATIADRRLDVDVAPATKGLHLSVHVPRDAAVKAPLEIAVTAGPLRWAGRVPAPGVAPILYVGPGHIQPHADHGQLELVAVSDPAILDARAHEDGVVTLHVVGEDAETLVVERPEPTPDYAVDVDADGMARLDVAALLADDPADNPVTHIASRRLLVRGKSGDRPLYRNCRELDFEHDGRPLSLRSNQDGVVHFIHRPAPQEAR